jgi:hypothetical protein
MNILIVTPSGGPIIRCIHPIWHSQTSSYFSLFGFINGQLEGTHSPDGQVLICEMTRIVSEMPPEILGSTFGARKDHLVRCETIDGDYIED